MLQQRTPLKPRREAPRRKGLPAPRMKQTPVQVKQTTPNMKRSSLKVKRDTPRRTGPATPRIKPERQEDPEHLERLRRFGCWCCRIDGLGWVYADAHHPRVGGKDGAGAAQRAPDREAIPVCPGLHHNVQVPGFISIHYQPLAWRERYGTEAEVCARVLKALESEDEPWPPMK